MNATIANLPGNPRAAAWGRARRRRGFTLVELMVVMAVLALLAMIGLPAASMSKDRKLDMLQLQLQDAVSHAQKLSYHSGARYAVKFDANGDWFAVLDEVGTPVQDPLTKGLYIIFLDRPDQPSGLGIDTAQFGNGSRPVVAFDDKGVLVDGGTIRIRADAEVRQLSMNTATAQFEEVPISG